MSSIDDRIVNMHFDNAKFEKGVAESINSIENLKVSLKNIDGTSVSFEKLQNAANGLKLDTISEHAETIASKFNVMGVVGATAIAKLTSGVMDFVSNGLGKAASKAKEVWDAISGGGMERAQNIEKAKFTVEGLGASFDKLKDSIDASVADTAYGFDEAAMAASQFLATGVKEGDEMTRSLTSISGLAAMTGSSYSEIARIMTTVAGNGRVMGQQLNEIGARGINAAAALTKYFNTSSERLEHWRDVYNVTKAKTKEPIGEGVELTEQNVRDMVSQGVIDFSTFSDAMYESFGEHAKEAQKTFSGASANVTAALKRIGADFQSITISSQDYVDTLDKAGKVDFTKSTFNQINVLNELRNVLKGLQTELKNAGFVKMFSDIYHTISKGMTFFLHGFLDPLNTASNVLAPELRQSLQNIKDALSNVFNFVVGIASSISNAWKAIFPESLNQTILNITKGIKDFTSMLPQIGDANKALSNIFGLPDISNLMGDNAKATEEAGNQITETAEEVAEAYDGVTGSLRELTAQVINGDYGNGQDRIDALGDSYQQIQDAVNSCYDSEGRLHEDWIDNIDETIRVGEQLNETISETEASAGVSEAEAQYQKLKGTLEQMFPVTREMGIEFEGLRVIFQGVFSMLDLGRKAISGIVEIGRRFFLPVVARIAQVVMEVVATIASWITALNSVTPSQEQFNGALEFLSNLLKPLWDGFHFVTQGVIDFFKALRPGGNVIEFIGNAFSNLIKTLSGFQLDLGDIGKKLQNRFETIFEFFSWIQLPDGRILGDVVGNFFSSVFDYFKDLPKSLNSAIGPTVEFFGGLGRRFSKAMSMEDASLLERVKYFFNPALNFLQELKSRLTKIFNPVLNYISPLVSDFAKLVKQLAKPFVDFFTDIYKSVASGGDPLEVIREKLADMVEALGPFGDVLKEKFDVVIQAVRKFINGVSTAIDNAGGNPFKALLTALGQAKDFISKGLKSFGDGEVGQNIGKIFENILKVLKASFENVKNFLVTAYKELTTYVKDMLKDGVKEAAGGLEELSTSLSSVNASVNGPGQDLMNFIVSLAKVMEKHIPDIVALIGIFKISSVFKDFSASIFNVSKSISQAIDAFSSIFQIPQQIASVIGEIKNVLTELTTSLKKFRKSVDFVLISEGLKSIAISIGILVAALVVLGAIPTDMLKQGAMALGILTGAFITLSGVFMYLAKKMQFGAMGKGILQMATGLLIFVVALAALMKMLNGVSIDANGNIVDAKGNLTKILIGIGLITALVTAIAVAIGLAARIAKTTMASMAKVGQAFAGLGVGVFLIVMALKRMVKIVESFTDEAGNVDWGKLGGIVAIVLLIGAAIAGIVVLLSKASKDAWKAGAAAVLLGVAILMITGALSILSNIKDTEALREGVYALSSLLIDMIALVAVFGYFAKQSVDMAKVGKNLLLMSVALGLLAVCLGALANLNMFNADAMQAGLDTLMTLIFGMMALTIAAGRMSESGNILKAAGAMLMISGAIAVLTACIYALTTVSDQLGPAVAALLLVALAIGALGMVASNMSGKLLVAGGALLMIAGALALVMLAMLALSMFAQDLTGPILAIAMIAAVLTLLMVVADSFKVGAVLLAAVLLSLAAVFATFALAAIAFGIAVTLVTNAFIAFLSAISDTSKTDGFIYFIEQIAAHVPQVLLLAAAIVALGIAVGIAGVAFIVGGVGLLAFGAGAMVAAAGVMMLGAAVASALTVVSAAIVAFAQAGYYLMVGLAQGLADGANILFSTLHSIIDGAIKSVMGWLGIASPSVVFETMGKFCMQGLGLGIAEDGSKPKEALKGVTADMVSQAKELPAEFKAIGSESAQGYAEGLSNMPAFASKITDAVKGVMKDGGQTAGEQSGDVTAQGFLEGTSVISPEMQEQMKSLGFDIEQFTSGDLSNIARTGFGNVGEAASQSMAEKIAQNSSSADEARAQVDAIADAAQAEVDTRFPQIGISAMQKINEGFTQMDLGATLLEGMTASMASTNQIGVDLANSVKTGLESVSFTETATAKVNEIVTTFTTALEIGSNVGSQFANTVKQGMDSVSFTMSGSIAGLQYIMGLASTLQGGFAIGMGFANSVKMGAASVNMSSSGVALGQQFISGLTAYTGVAFTVGWNLGSTAKSGAESVQMGSAGMQNGMEFCTGLASFIGMALFNGLMLGNSARSGAESVDMAPSGSQNASEFVSGINSQSGEAYNAGYNLGQSAADGARDGSGDMYGVGVDIGQGLANGISSMISSVASNAAELVNSAISAARAAADINSPSKKFMSIGHSMGEGLIMGVNDYMSQAADAGGAIGGAAVDAVNETVGKMMDILGSDLDSAPVIRPVLDDSDLKRGLHSLNSTMENYGMGGRYAMGIADRMSGTSSFGSGYSESGLAKAIASELIKSEAVGNGDTSITFNAYGVDSPQQFSRETMHKVSQIQRAR